MSKLCGFVWCHGVKDFSLWETDALLDSDLATIESILMKYDNTGTSVRNCWGDKISELMNENYD